MKIINLLLVMLFLVNVVFAQESFAPLLNAENRLIEEKDLQEGRREDDAKIATHATTSKIFILTYHQIRNFEPTDSLFAKTFITTPQIFLQELEYFHDNNFKVISPYEYRTVLENATSTQKYAMLTFDDGYKSNFDTGIPIMERFGYKGLFFIYSNAISKFPISMTWEDLKKLLDKGNLIGGHTLSHLKLTKIKDSKILDKEIFENKKVLEENLKTKVDFFAYPYGLRNKLIIQKVKDAGYLGAFSDIRGTLHTKKDTYEINRLNMNSNYKEFLNFVTN